MLVGLDGVERPVNSSGTRAEVLLVRPLRLRAKHDLVDGDAHKRATCYVVCRGLFGQRPKVSSLRKKVRHSIAEWECDTVLRSHQNLTLLL